MRKCDDVWHDFCTATGPIIRLHGKINVAV